MPTTFFANICVWKHRSKYESTLMNMKTYKSMVQAHQGLGPRELSAILPTGNHLFFLLQTML